MAVSDSRTTAFLFIQNISNRCASSLLLYYITVQYITVMGEVGVWTAARPECHGGVDYQVPTSTTSQVTRSTKNRQFVILVTTVEPYGPTRIPAPGPCPLPCAEHGSITKITSLQPAHHTSSPISQSQIIFLPSSPSPPPPALPPWTESELERFLLRPASPP